MIISFNDYMLKGYFRNIGLYMLLKLFLFYIFSVTARKLKIQMWLTLKF